MSEGAKAYRIIADYCKSGNSFTLGSIESASVWQPNRNVLSYAGEGEEYAAYIQPYDILEYMPKERSRISIHQSDIKDLHVSEGTILQTCSGRNLGPLVIADKYLEQFVLGSDLIRINITDKKIRNYVFAFFNTWIGQALLHANKTGSVIDHLSRKDIEAIQIPLIQDNEMTMVSENIEAYSEHYSQARSLLSELSAQFNKDICIEEERDKLAYGWGVSVKSLLDKNRIDAAYYDPYTVEAVEKLKAIGGIPLETVADVIKPAGRYKTNYVSKEHGKPLISGRQLLQEQVVNLKYLPKTKIDSFSSHLLKESMIAYPADGRVEGRLGSPTYIGKSRSGWYASGHVGRVIAYDNVSPGYIYLAMNHPVVQSQISALACGSVVDAVYPDDVKKIIIPPQVDFPYDNVIKGWNLFESATEHKNLSCEIILKALEK